MAGRRFDSSLPPIFELPNRHLAVYICFSNSAKQGVGPILKFFRNGATVVKIEDEVYRSPWLLRGCWYWEVSGCLPEKHSVGIDVMGPAVGVDLPLEPCLGPQHGSWSAVKLLDYWCVDPPLRFSMQD